jgi:hypothetical protein
VDRDPHLLERLAGWAEETMVALGDDGVAVAGSATGGAARAPHGAASSVEGRPGERTVTPLVGDVLLPLDRLGGPADGIVDLVVSHAVADLLPLDRFAARVAALLRPGGLAHLALTYDGETEFLPSDDPDLTHPYRPLCRTGVERAGYFRLSADHRSCPSDRRETDTTQR